MWKVFIFSFYVKGYCSYSWMFKVCTFGFRCWKFLFLFLDIEGFYFILECWRFLLLLLDVEGYYFYSWMLKVCDYWSFVYMHFLKKMMWKKKSILFKSCLYKFNLTYNDERFMKGDLWMIIMLHVSCFVFEHLWWLLLFLCYTIELSLCFNINIKIMYKR